MLLHVPVRDLLGGFCFDFHWKGERWLHFFAFPLFVPHDFVNLSWGWRLPTPPYSRSSSPVLVEGEPEQLKDTVRVLREEGLPLLMPILELEGFYKFLTDPPRNLFPTSSIRTCEALAYTAILLDRFDVALVHIDDALIHLADLQSEPGARESAGEDERPWIGQIRERVVVMGELLAEKKIEEAKAQLTAWREASADSLGIRNLL